MHYTSSALLGKSAYTITAWRNIIEIVVLLFEYLNSLFELFFPNLAVLKRCLSVFKLLVLLHILFLHIKRILL